MKSIRKLTAALLLLALCLSLCACGGKQSEAPAPAQPTLPGTAAADAPQGEDDLAAIKEKVLALKEHPVSELYEAIGEPNSADYAPSCLGPGEDGCLYYDGFTVYTYKEGDSEVVWDVE